MARADSVELKSVVVKERLRSDMGDIDGLVSSIKELGLIQPIVLVGGDGVGSNDGVYLLAGGRRLEALRRVGVTDLIHAKHFVWSDELDPLKLQAIELEENLRRKELTWQEVVLGKKRLLETMQAIHGVASAGGRTREELRTGVSSGFGIRKLAAMLGESPASTSRDVQIAEIIEKIPSFAAAESKSIAFRKACSVAAFSDLLGQAKPTVKDFVLYEGDFRNNIAKVPDASVDLIVTDLPYGSGASDQHRLSGKTMLSFDDSKDNIVGLLPDVAKESYRILKDNRFVAFFFGFAIYDELRDALLAAGFKVNRIPAVWIKNSAYSENPHMFYSNAYEPILVAMKGTPLLIRQGASNVMQFSQVARSEKMHLAEKPSDLIERMILDMTLPGATVCDLMCGAGSTGVAALRNRRRAILFELNPSSCKFARAKLEAL